MLFLAILQLLLPISLAQEENSPYCLKDGFYDKPMVVCDWTEWTPCCLPKTQEIKPFQFRYRTHFDCTGVENLDYEFNECPNPYSEWSTWSDCQDDTCGGKGFLFRSRTVCEGVLEDQIDNFACSIGYMGEQCDTCENDFYMLSGDCLECLCDCVGSEAASCQDIDGQCECKVGYSGVKCENCDEGFYRDEEGMCIECLCDATKGSDNAQCDTSGKCPCKTNYIGLKCDSCVEDFYLDADGLCQSCTCDEVGSQACLSPTGMCVCKDTFTGSICDQCANNYYKDQITNQCLECPAGWFYLDQSCYFVHGEKMAFEEAKAKCESLSSKLFEPMSEEQNKAIFDIMLAKYGDDTEYYVGISIQDAQDGGSFVYVSSGAAVSLEIWGADQTTNRDGINHCVTVDSQNFGLMWADRYCTDRRVFICEKP